MALILVASVLVSSISFTGASTSPRSTTIRIRASARIKHGASPQTEIPQMTIQQFTTVSEQSAPPHFHTAPDQ